MFIHIYQAKYCGCGVLHDEKICPKCSSDTYVYLLSMLNEKLDKTKWLYCSNCDTEFKYDTLLTVEFNGTKQTACPGCGNTVKLEDNTNETLLQSRKCNAGNKPIEMAV